MHTVLLTLRQWGTVDGTITRPVPADASNATTSEKANMEAWDLRYISAFIELSFRVDDSAKIVLGNTHSPKGAWDILEKRFRAK